MVGLFSYRWWGNSNSALIFVAGHKNAGVSLHSVSLLRSVTEKCKHFFALSLCRISRVFRVSEGASYLPPSHNDVYAYFGYTEFMQPDEEPEMYTPTPDDDASDQPEAPKSFVPDDDEPVHWSATEYIPQEKGGLWFALFAIVVIALIAADIFWIKSYTFSVLVVVMAATVIILSLRPPRNIDYTLSGDQGLYIGEVLHHFSEFKSFGLIQEHNQNSIMLIPVKRFSPGVSVYFPNEAGEEIVDILGARLPMENLKLDFIDVIVRKLRL